MPALPESTHVLSVGGRDATLIQWKLTKEEAEPVAVERVPAKVWVKVIQARGLKGTTWDGKSADVFAHVTMDAMTR